MREQLTATPSIPLVTPTAPGVSPCFGSILGEVEMYRPSRMAIVSRKNTGPKAGLFNKGQGLKVSRE